MPTPPAMVVTITPVKVGAADGELEPLAAVTLAVADGELERLTAAVELGDADGTDDGDAVLSLEEDGAPVADGDAELSLE